MRAALRPGAGDAAWTGPLGWACAGLLVVGLWTVGDRTLSRGLPAGIVLQGVVYGALYALVAMGIVLVYRANRVVNFAQAEFGSVAAVLAIEFVLRLHVNYFVAFGGGLVIATVSGALVELGVLRWFRTAPRLIVMVVTIGLAQILAAAAVGIPLLWSGLSATRFSTPWKIHFNVYPVVFDGNAVFAMVMVGAVVVALALFLRFTHYGVAIRAAAENGDRAELLGIPVRRLSTLVWAIAGFLSALAVLLRVPILGFASFTSVSGGGPPLLLRALAAAVIGGMTSLPEAAAAAVGIGIIEELGAWHFHNGSYVDGLLLAVVMLTLFVRREKFSRSFETGIGTFRAIREVRPIPSELASLPEVRLTSRLGQLGLAAGALVLPFLLPPSKQQLAGVIAIYAIVAVSLVVLTGWSGHISLGHFALVGFGAATTGTLVAVHHVDLMYAVPAGALAGAGVALLLGLPALQIRGPYLAVTTLAFAVSSSTFFLDHRYLPWLVPAVPVDRPVLWRRIALGSDREIYYLCVLCLLLVLVLARNLRTGRTGRAIIAVRDNQLAAQASGMGAIWLQLQAFAVSGGIAGFAGALFVLHQEAFHTGAFSATESLTLFSMVVIGGLGSVPGAVLGAVYIKAAEFLLPPAYALLASGLGIVVLLIVLPEGLGGAVYRVRDGLLRRVARRRSIIVPSLTADVRVEKEDSKITLDAALGGLAGVEAL